MIALLFLLLFGDVSQFVFELCKRGVGFRVIIEVLIVASIGEWSEVRS